VRAIAFGGAEPGRLELRYLSVNADVRDGDVVVTSGLDSLYPAGLPVGRVVKVDRSRSGNFATIVVDPLAGVDRSRLLLVLLVDKSAQPPPPPPEAVEPIRGKRAVARIQ
jgi:rod shape-determining protein MreC